MSVPDTKPPANASTPRFSRAWPSDFALLANAFAWLLTAIWAFFALMRFLGWFAE